MSSSSRRRAETKTLWDWLDLLVVPVGVAAAAALITSHQATQDANRAETQRGIAQRAATERNRAQLLRTYLHDMSELVLIRGLVSGKPAPRVVALAGAITKGVLPQLDNVRKGAILSFLVEVGALDPTRVSLDLAGANARGAVMDGVSSDAASFEGMDLQRADLHGSEIKGSEPDGVRTVSFAKADLRHANFTNTVLFGVRFDGADLRDARFRDAILINVSFDDTCLSGAKFDRVDVTGGHFDSAEADRLEISDAKLDGADVTSVRFFRVKSTPKTRINGNAVPPGWSAKPSSADAPCDGFPEDAKQ